VCQVLSTFGAVRHASSQSRPDTFESLYLETSMDLFRVHAQVVQMVMKMLLAVVATALFFIVRLVLPFIRSAVVALVRFPAVVADRHYESQHAEVEWLLAEARRVAKASAVPLVPKAQLFPVATAMPASEPDTTATPDPDGPVEATAEHPRVPTPAAVEVPASEAEPTPEPDPEDRAEVDEGPVLRYRPRPASGD
jgi:hypothetical protein